MALPPVWPATQRTQYEKRLNLRNAMSTQLAAVTESINTLPAVEPPAGGGTLVISRQQITDNQAYDAMPGDAESAYTVLRVADCDHTQAVIVVDTQKTNTVEPYVQVSDEDGHVVTAVTPAGDNSFQSNKVAVTVNFPAATRQFLDFRSGTGVFAGTPQRYLNFPIDSITLSGGTKGTVTTIPRNPRGVLFDGDSFYNIPDLAGGPDCTIQRYRDYRPGTDFLSCSASGSWGAGRCPTPALQDAYADMIVHGLSQYTEKVYAVTQIINAWGNYAGAPFATYVDFRIIDLVRAKDPSIVIFVRLCTKRSGGEIPRAGYNIDDFNAFRSAAALLRSDYVILSDDPSNPDILNGLRSDDLHPSLPAGVIALRNWEVNQIETKFRPNIGTAVYQEPPLVETLLWEYDGTTVDSSGYGHDLQTAGSGAAVEFVNGKIVTHNGQVLTRTMTVTDVLFRGFRVVWEGFDYEPIDNNAFHYPVVVRDIMDFAINTNGNNAVISVQSIDAAGVYHIVKSPSIDVGTVPVSSIEGIIMNGTLSLKVGNTVYTAGMKYPQGFDDPLTYVSEDPLTLDAISPDLTEITIGAQTAASYGRIACYALGHA